MFVEVGPDVAAYDVLQRLAHNTGEADGSVILWLAGGILLEDWCYVCCAPSRW